MTMPDYEKLGLFYLGRQAGGAPAGADLLYDARDLTTHGLVVGMTGSGKTGLGAVLLEEAAMDGIPSVVVDPKGDLTNLLLRFPDLRPSDFRPWVDAAEAERAGANPDLFAEQQARAWSDGLARWNQDGGRIARLAAANSVRLYTPGLASGAPVSLLSSFAAPAQAVRNDLESLRERAANTVSGLLALMGEEADPLQDREHILLTTILERAWQAGQSLDVGSLLAAVQAPPFDRLGFLDLETVFPAKDRLALAMRLNNLVAAPTFASWLTGEPLDPGAFLWDRAGRPRTAVFTTAHLGEAERMFFTSLLLTSVLSWMRTQPGTSTLRALFYMDEIAGYFPPVANPPSKAPLVTLLKQARAYGVGIVLATQNPVDLDYRGLGNIGTWWIGRLQTEQDKERLLEGLLGAGGGATRTELSEAIGSLPKRRFYMRNIHAERAFTLETRWAMSWLRGPLDRNQVRALCGSQEQTSQHPPPPPPPTGPPPGATAEPTAASSPSRGKGTRGAHQALTPERPILPAGMHEGFLATDARFDGAALRWRPFAGALIEAYVHDVRKGVERSFRLARLAALPAGPGRPDWDAATALDDAAQWLDAPPAEGLFEAWPACAANARKWETWAGPLRDWVARSQGLAVLHCAGYKTSAKNHEDESAFRARLQMLAREARDAAVEKLKTKYAASFARLKERLRRAQLAVDQQQDQAKEAKASAAVGFGASILGAVFGRGSGNVGRAASAARGAGRAWKQGEDVEQARANLAAAEVALRDLEQAFTEDARAAAASASALAEEITTLTIKPRKTDIEIRRFGLLWAPYHTPAGGGFVPAFSQSPAAKDER